jgi:hypothetical protein
MNKKRIEEIIGAAFGENVGELGQLTDAERRELETAQKMKQGLASLKDVPDHQLSNERLRNAILGSQVQRRPRFALWSYGSAAVACLAVALLAIQSMNSRVVPPSIDNDVDSNGTSETLALKENNASDPVGQTDIRRTNNIVSNDSPSVRRNPTPDASLSLDDVDAEYRALKDGGTYSTMVSGLDFGPADGVVMQPAAMAAGPESVVVVDSATLTNNGAARAKEVASNSDVVFGG